MKRIRFTEEQIIEILREAEAGANDLLTASDKAKAEEPYIEANFRAY